MSTVFDHSLPSDLRPFARAEMIHPLADQGVGAAAPALAKHFQLQQASGENVYLTITALGLYRCFINGQRVGRDQLTPGWTAFDLRLPYQCYEVSDLLISGENRIEIWLADGWLRSQMMWRDVEVFNTWGDKLGALAEMQTVGGELLVRTDRSWVSGETPIRKSGIYLGEHYDAGREQRLAFDQGVEVLPFNKDLLFAHDGSPVRELQSFKPVRQWLDDQGRALLDFGQNLAGYVAFTVSAEPGDEIIVEHSEILGPNGEFDNRNYRTAEAMVRYRCRGGGESFRPHFTFFGYRYARITLSGSARLERIESVPISSVQDMKGEFECANPLVNQLVSNTRWSQRANFIEAPTDCPQRDERLGWTGDAQVFAGTACYLHDSHRFLKKWLSDVIAEQTEEGAIPHVVPNPTRRDSSKLPNFAGSTGWGDVIHVLPLALWRHYGDREVLEMAFPAMQRWVDFVWSISNGPIVRPPRSWDERGFSFGDWLQPSGPTDKPNATIGDDAAATIYLFVALRNTAQVADILGNGQAARALSVRADEVKAAFEQEFITPSGRIGYSDQTSYALAFLYDLVPERHWPAARRYFVQAVERTGKTIGTGFIGTPALLPALIKVGEWRLAEELFLQESVPGWLYQVKQGATTIWERWDAIAEDGTVFAPDMNSYNHYAYGAVCEWLFAAVAGIRPATDQPGFDIIEFSPVILPRLGPVAARHCCRHGTIKASWSVQGDRVEYQLVIPEGATGRFVNEQVATELRLNGEQVTESSLASLPPGRHCLNFRLATLATPMRSHKTSA